jgi:RNA polymerase sigma factor (sigma-70 family)
MNPPPDSTLSRLVAEGDELAFEALYRRHADALLRYCRSIVRHREDAEEALQSSMLRAYRALAGGSRPEAVRPWLFGIARNECHDLLRCRLQAEPLPAQTPARAADAPEAAVERRMRLRALRDDLDLLPRRQRAALVLRGLWGMPHDQIGAILGASSGEARNLVHEARTSLDEFEAGRELGCSEVQARLAGADGRVLRGRRIRAHLRGCEECRRVAGTARRGVGALLPVPVWLALRALFGAGRAVLTGSTGAVAGALGGGAAVVVSALVIVGGLPGGGSSPGPAPAQAGSPSAVASVPSTASAGAPPRTAGPAAGRAAPATPPREVVGSGTTPQPSSSGAPDPAVTPVAGGPAAAAPVSPAPAPAGGSSGSGGGLTVRVPAAGVSVTVPPVSTPPISTPSVTVPSVSVPSVTVPSVSVPSVTVPSVSVPSVRLPDLPAPLPPVQTPGLTLPQVRTPPVSLPSVQTPPVATPPIQVPGVTVPGITLLPGSG